VNPKISQRIHAAGAPALRAPQQQLLEQLFIFDLFILLNHGISESTISNFRLYSDEAHKGGTPIAHQQTRQRHQRVQRQLRKIFSGPSIHGSWI
jgi:hypothetical protein